ncbi:helix-turn-helix transcriptional regulator [Actinomycetaceae bacterium WB03_NA08]|uniref:Helix-turn-helix transcriptional regulator n=1 Tax=Scrofimicrobium canadense TaxID=2652290 RepID=A0A6N7W7Z4_9ACTO|nr:helix-turn-helix transcriptional regulator [Scrofimicrobium canadense]MSS84258.1 helix-turn-helix transcriptional regulator [Scrofimicrobium canadense]
MPDQPRFVISVAAELADMHPQTLRQYDRLGLVAPSRTKGGGRRYSHADIARLREIQRLSQEEGVNLAGIQRIMELSDQVRRLQHQVAQLRADAASQRRRPRVFTADAEGAISTSFVRTLVDHNYQLRNIPTSVLQLLAANSSQ